MLPLYASSLHLPTVSRGIVRIQTQNVNHGLLGSKAHTGLHSVSEYLGAYPLSSLPKSHCMTLARPGSSSINSGGPINQSEDNGNNDDSNNANSWALKCARHYANQFTLTVNFIFKMILQYRYRTISISQMSKLRICDLPKEHLWPSQESKSGLSGAQIQALWPWTALLTGARTVQHPLFVHSCIHSFSPVWVHVTGVE